MILSLKDRRPTTGLRLTDSKSTLGLSRSWAKQRSCGSAAMDSSSALALRQRDKAGQLRISCNRWTSPAVSCFGLTYRLTPRHAGRIPEKLMRLDLRLDFIC
ncbi:hypothetical protein BaRGS_00003789 [Batillaria attramentaria]|uniref:Uncharacterized protein n=1 Tax=Batillaria attramentaria TaxID=370345 RepID=A0ABD0LZ68_9CAEN